MSTPALAGLLDSGIDPAFATDGGPRRSFVLDANADPAGVDDGAPDLIGHGTALARIVLEANPGARLAVARIFIDRVACTPAAAAAGLDWLVGQGVRVVNMSFGLREDRGVLREACGRAAAGGVILLGAAPARGPGVYPSSYDGVIRISGDARLGPGEISTLGGAQADFGACPRPLGAEDANRPAGGASFAVAHVTALALRFLARDPDANADSFARYLTSTARFHGPERRGADNAPPTRLQGDAPCNH